MKNVAGYDLCKLLVGSLGTLAVLTEVTLRLRPLPETEALVWCCFDSLENLEQLLDRLNTSETRPIAIELLDARAARQVAAESRQTLPSSGPVLCVGYEGVAEECRWQVQQLQREVAFGRPREMAILEPPHTAALWEALTEYPTFSDDPVSFQASLLPSATAEFCPTGGGFRRVRAGSCGQRRCRGAFARGNNHTRRCPAHLDAPATVRPISRRKPGRPAVRRAMETAPSCFRPPTAGLALDAKDQTDVRSAQRVEPGRLS
ncbi:MAG: FAD-binding oxidoreductase [Planctomycetes bacterium]|nr:FAD-binding oxidoreductase [Planctomycetota bacterium]